MAKYLITLMRKNTESYIFETEARNAAEAKMVAMESDIASEDSGGWQTETLGDMYVADCELVPDARSKLVQVGDIAPFSDEWKEYVADAVALDPILRDETQKQAIEEAFPRGVRNVHG